MSKSIAISVLLAGAILLATLLPGCSDEPSPAPTSVPTATATQTGTPTPTRTATPIATPSPVPTATTTSVPTATPTQTVMPTATPTPTPVPTATPTPTPTLTPTPTPPPDLVVDTPTLSDSSPMTDQALTLRVTVGNRGSGSSGPTTLTYYRSDDSTITPADTEVGTDGVAGLGASESSAESILTYAPSALGAYYYGACVDSMPGEPDTTNNCSAAVAVAVSQFDTDSLPWVADGITDSERQAMDHIRVLATIDRSMSQRVAGSPWLSDGVTEDELWMLADLRDFAGSHPEIAVLVTTVPDQTGRLIEAVLQQIRFYDPGRLGQIREQPWFQDRLTEDEAALIVVLQSAADSEDVFRDLLQGGHVRSDTISLPLAGEVDLFAVGRSESQLGEVLGNMAFAVESMEAFMGTAWPRPDIIALLELDKAEGGWNSGTHVVVKSTLDTLTYHELAHFYFGAGASVPVWLSEGAANFLTSHAIWLTGDAGSISSKYFQDQIRILEVCAPHGSANVQGFIETEAGDSYCPYLLGHKFLAGMYRTLGHEVVSSALRELFEAGEGTGRTATEDEIYRAFLTNTPSSQRNDFQLWYHCLHGRPIPGYTAAPKAAPPPEIRDALVALYNATNGPGWKTSENWLSEAPLDQWHGVATDCDGSVTGLRLVENQLTGPIPPELASLSKLAGLDLSNNQLTGPIPPELASLSKLAGLDLSNNQLTGPIPPELGSLSKLVGLDLSSNQLTGPIPPELGSLSKLVDLDLVVNRLTGPIPPELGNLSKLKYLALQGNQLTGPIPFSLGDLSVLDWLDLSRNQLTGPIPPELARLTDLRYLILRGNQLNGPIPPELGNLSALEYLHLSGNPLTGCVPATLKAIENNDIEGLGLEVCTDS